MRVDESCKTATGFHFVVASSADVPEHFVDTVQKKSEGNDVQIIASQKRKKRKCYVSFSSESSSTDTHSEPVDKRSRFKP